MSLKGATLVPAAVFGNIIGGTLVRKLKLHTHGMLLMALIVDCSSLIFGLCFLLYCPLTDLAGVNVPYEPIPYACLFNYALILLIKLQ